MLRLSSNWVDKIDTFIYNGIYSSVMEKKILGRIPQRSLDRVRKFIFETYPKAVSRFAIKQSVSIKWNSIESILKYLEVLGDIEKIETTGDECFWKWKLRNK